MIERSGVSRGHSIPKQVGEGLNVERSLNFAGLESNAMKAANPDRRRDYQREVGVELRGNAGEPSIAPVSAGGEDGKAVDTSRLLEKVIDRDNLNHAYKRVMKNGGSHGVDGMKVENCCRILKQTRRKPRDSNCWKGSTSRNRYAG